MLHQKKLKIKKEKLNPMLITGRNNNHYKIKWNRNQQSNMIIY